MLEIDHKHTFFYSLVDMKKEMMKSEGNGRRHLLEFSLRKN